MRRQILFLVALSVLIGTGAVYGANDAGLLGWWKFDEGSGTIASDSSGNGNNGTLMNGPQWVAGNISGALHFDGIDDYVDLGNKPVWDPTGSFSVSLWANIEVWNVDRGHALIANRGLSGQGWALRRSTSTTLYFTVRGVTTEDTESKSPVFLSPIQWIHIVCVYDSVNHTKRIYLNGVEDVMVTVTGTYAPANTYNTYIGARANPTPQGFFTGKLDDVRYYTRVVASAEIAQIMKGTPPGMASTPNPTDKNPDVYRKTPLTWTKGQYAAKHNVYFGASFDAVSKADTSSPLWIGKNQDVNTYDPGSLPFSTTYYWRVDEINGPAPC